MLNAVNSHFFIFTLNAYKSEATLYKMLCVNVSPIETAPAEKSKRNARQFGTECIEVL